MTNYCKEMSGLLIVSFFCVVGVFGSVVTNGGGYKETKPFKDFSYNLLLQSDLDEFSVEKGAAISSPFGVGYMLANINEKVWNVSNDGFDGVLNYKDGKIAEEYQSLIDLLNKGKMSTGSTLFTRDQNISATFPEGSLKMKTETKYVNFIDDWKTTWLTMNGRISNQTNGKLDDQLIPKGGWWGGAFYYFTLGSFINTNHYKSSWAATWTNVGPKKFSDGLSVPFYETEGTLPYLETDNYTAVSVGLKEGKKSVVFVLPNSKVPFVEFLKTDMIKLVQNAAPQGWNSLKAKKIQFPALNITLLDQHYKKLEAMGLRASFCVDEPESVEVANKKGPYFMGPIVQSHHIQFNPEFFEVATATGASLNSEEKMREEAQFDYPGPPPSGPSGSGPSGSGEQIAEGSEFVLPVDMDAKLAKSLADGSLEVKKVEMIVEDKENNDTITAASTTSLEEVAPPSSPIVIANETVKVSPSNVSEQIELTTGVPTDAPTTTAFVAEPLPENTIRFDRPFFWYLHDEELGPLYYGSVHSLATYAKEYGIETDEDLWLYDAYKTLLWNCP